MRTLPFLSSVPLNISWDTRILGKVSVIRTDSGIFYYLYLYLYLYPTSGIIDYLYLYLYPASKMLTDTDI